MKQPEQLPQFIAQAEKHLSTLSAQVIGLATLLYANYIAFSVAPGAIPKEGIDQGFYIAICAGPMVLADAFLAIKLVQRLMAEPVVVAKSEWQPRAVEGYFLVEIPGEKPRTLESGESVEVVKTPTLELRISPINGGDVMNLKMQRHTAIAGEQEGESVRQTSFLSAEWGPAHLLPSVSRLRLAEQVVAVDISANRFKTLADGRIEVLGTDLIFSADFKELYVRDMESGVRLVAEFKWFS